MHCHVHVQALTSRFRLKTYLHTCVCIYICRNAHKYESISTLHIIPVAPQQSPLEFLNITVSRTHQNSGLVVQWVITHDPPPGTVFTYYQARHRRSGEGEGEGEGELVRVNANQRWIFVDDLENAQDYEVRNLIA